MPVEAQDRERRAVDRRGRAAGAGRRLPAAGASCSSTASLSKLKGTYTDKLPLMVNPATGRVHTTYAQAVAVTGRLSSNDPNLQNIPIRTAEGRRVREAFIAPPKAPRSSRPTTRRSSCASWRTSRPTRACWRAFGERHRRAPRDRRRGLRRGGRPRSSSEQRRYAKVINFGLIYGMSAFGLAANLGIERSAATAYIERYFARYPGRQALHGRDPRVGAASRATSRRCSAAASTCPRSGKPRPAPQRRRAAGDQRADAGHGGRPDQAGDDRGAGARSTASSGRRG